MKAKDARQGSCGVTSHDQERSPLTTHGEADASLAETARALNGTGVNERLALHVARLPTLFRDIVRARAMACAVSEQNLSFASDRWLVKTDIQTRASDKVVRRWCVCLSCPELF